MAKIFLFALVALYFVFCFSPLRLHYDTIRYFAIKDCIELGCPPESDAAKDFFPFGYTALLLLFSKLGILSSFSIVFVNALYLFGGLLFLYKVFQKKISLVFFFVLVLSNWLFIKFVAHPLSEMQYLFLSMACIYFFHLYIQSKKIKFLIVAVFLCWLALQTRTVGISLVAGLAVGFLWEYKTSVLLFLKKKKILVACMVTGGIAAVIIFAKELGIRHYLGVLTTHLKEAPFFTRLGWHFTEWGEVVLNLPAGKAVEKLPMHLGSALFITVGIAFFLWFCFVFFVKKNAIPLFLKAYLFFYFIIIFNWPFADPRFWVPVLPIIIMAVLHCPIQTKKGIRILSSLFFIFYISMGLLSAVFMIYSSFNKQFLAKSQASGVYRNEYEVYFFANDAKPAATTLNSSDSIRTVIVGDTTKVVNPYIIGLLKRYN